MTKNLVTSSESMEQLANGENLNMEVLGPEGQRSSRALEMVDFAMRPHYKRQNKYSFITDDLLQKAANISKCDLYAISDDCAIKVEDNSIEVIGGGEWKKFNAIKR